MKQILQDLRKGQTRIIETPIPNISPKHILIHSTQSLISTGTERMLLDFGKASYFAKMKQQPEKVKLVKEKIKTDGLFATIDAVQSKLAQPLPLGYCQVGRILEVGAGVTTFSLGQRVVSNGPHAEVVKVSHNLCAAIPDAVDDEMAAFTVPASIGLQGLRLAELTLGESVVVMGAGLIGLLTIQLLKAHGCRVLAIDLDAKKLALAQQFGAETCNLALGEEPVDCGLRFSRGRGVDAVLITAATQSDAPVQFAAQMSRKRGRIILIGVTGLHLNRADFYDKELRFQVSCSYGPGRYDPSYERQGYDYPLGLVRWSAQRNFEAVLDMMNEGRLQVSPLITHRFAFTAATEAYDVLSSDRQALGIMLSYPENTASAITKKKLFFSPRTFDPAQPIIGMIGAGNYAAKVLIPQFKAAHVSLHTLVTKNGLHGAIEGEKAAFMQTSTDVEDIFADLDINTVVIATQHDSHAELVVKALQATKHVFVEKPLALNLKTLSEIETAYHLAAIAGQALQIMVGFNRRFSPQIQTMKHLLQSVSAPKSMIITINAGTIPKNHWTQDAQIGGGRILGEVCHFIDLMRYLINHPICSFHITALHPQEKRYDDTVSITIRFADGSIGTIHYFANGTTIFPKERIEVFASNRILQLDNFRLLRGYGWPQFRKQRLWRQDKGQTACIKAFVQAIQTGIASIPIAELFEIARISIAIDEVCKQQTIPQHTGIAF